MSEHIEYKAKAIVEAGNVQTISDTEYLVKSSDTGTLYNVVVGKQETNELGYLCNCTAGSYEHSCKHGRAVEIYRERFPALIKVYAEDQEIK